MFTPGARPAALPNLGDLSRQYLGVLYESKSVLLFITKENKYDLMTMSMSRGSG